MKELIVFLTLLMPLSGVEPTPAGLDTATSVQEARTAEVSPLATSLAETQTVVRTLAEEVAHMPELTPQDAQEVLDTLLEIQREIGEEQKKAGPESKPRGVMRTPRN